MGLWSATSLFTGEEPNQVAAIAIDAPGEHTGYTMVARTGSGINSYADLKGKKIAAYNPAVPVYNLIFEAGLRAYGLSRLDVTPVPNTSYGELVPILRENRADAIMLPVRAGSAGIVDLTETGTGYLVGLDPDKAEIALRDVPFYRTVTFPAGTFKGQDKDILSLAGPGHMTVRLDLPETLVYTMVRIMFDNNEEFQTYGGYTLKYFMPESASLSLIVIPFHPGAIRYLEEKGFWTAEHEKLQQELLESIK